MKTLFRIGFSCALAWSASSSHAQYEQLLQDPSLAEKSATPAAPVAPPPPRLLSPALHRDRILHLDQSPDGKHLLSLDAKVLKIWDVENRAAIVTHGQDPRGTHPSRAQELVAAWFTKTPRQVVVCTTQNIFVFDDFDFSKPSARHPRFNPTAYHFDLASNAVIIANFDADKQRLGLRRLDLEAGEEKHLSFVDFAAEKLKPPGQLVRPAWPQPFTMAADGKTVAFAFDGELPLFLIDPASGAITARVPAELGAVGLLPDGRVLGRKVADKKNTLSIIDPVTRSVTPLAEIAEPEKPVVRLPVRRGEPVVLTGSDTLWLHDLEAGTTSRRFQTTGRQTSVVLPLREGGRTRPLVAQVSYKSGSTDAAATYLDIFDPVAGVFRARWNEPLFAPDAFFTRGDDFDLVVRNDGVARRVSLTEAGLVVEPLDYSAKALGRAHAFYDDALGRWLLLSGGQPLLGELDPAKPDAAAYRVVPFATDGKQAPTLYRTHFIDRSRDGALLALHHGNAVSVVDVTARRRVALFPIDTNIAYAHDNTQLLALSPDGTVVAYSYVAMRDGKQVELLECREVAGGALKWSLPRVNGDSSIDNLKFSADGRVLYLTGRDSLARFESLYTSTGEVAGWLSGGGRFSYNRGATLVAQVSGSGLEVRALPSGDSVAKLTLPAAPRNAAFIGSDRFLIVDSSTDELLRLVDLREQAVVAEISLFESPKKWLVRHPATGLFSSEASVQSELRFAQGERITPLESYFDEFYRPRLLGSLVKGLSPRPSIPLSDLRYAPKLTLTIDGPSTRGLSVEDEFETFELPTAKVTLRLDATCEGSPISDLRVYHNGKLVAGATRGLGVEDDEEPPAAEVFTRTASHTFALTPGKNRFRAVAINAQGTESAPDEIVVYSEAVPPVDENAGMTLHVVTIGVNAYRNPDYNLNYARADADAVAEHFRARMGKLFTHARHHSLRDAEATRENILVTLEMVKREAGPRDAFVLYYAGHGVMSDDGGDPEFFLAPHEVVQLHGERRVLRQLGVPGRELLAFSRDIAAQKQLFILDACQSAGALKDVAVRGAVEERAIAQLARSSGTHWLTATGSEQFATEFQKLGHGVFTKVLLDALNGAADAGDGVVSVNELKAYIEAKVPELTAAEKGSAQYPVTYGYGQDFPVGIVAP